MKINPYITNQYRKTSATSAASSAPAVGESHARPDSHAAKIDRFVISRDGSNQSLVSGLSKKMAEGISSQDSAARIEQLHAAVRDGSYYVSTEDLAETIMAHMM